MSKPNDKPKLIIPPEAAGLSADAPLSPAIESEAPAEEGPRRKAKDGYLAPTIGTIRISCDKCQAGFFPNNDANNGACRAEPPKSQILFLQKPPTVAGAAPAIQGHVDAAWPPIFRDQWCLCFKPRTELLN